MAGSNPSNGGNSDTKHVSFLIDHDLWERFRLVSHGEDRKPSAELRRLVRRRVLEAEYRRAEEPAA